MSCCGKKRKASDASRPTLASPIGVIKPRTASPPMSPGTQSGDARRDAPVTNGR
jgi:hypothetical protein